MKGLFQILIKYRLSVMASLLSIFVAITLTYICSRFKNKFIKFIPSFLLIIVGTLFLSDGWINIVTPRGVNALYYATILGTSGVVSLFYALLLMTLNRNR